MQEINLYSLLKYYAKNWLVIFIFVIIGLIVGVVYNSFIQIPKFQSTATIFVTGPEQSAISKDSTIINNYLELITSRRVLEPVITELKLNKDYDQLASAVSATNQKDTAVIKLNVVTDSPETSKTIANSTVESFKKQTNDIYGKQNIQVVDGASLPSKAYNVRKSLQLALATVASALSAIIIMFFVYDYKNSNPEPSPTKANKSNLKVKKATSKTNVEHSNRSGRFAKKSVKAKKK